MAAARVRALGGNLREGNRGKQKGVGAHNFVSMIRETEKEKGVEIKAKYATYLSDKVMTVRRHGAARAVRAAVASKLVVRLVQMRERVMYVRRYSYLQNGERE